MFDVSCARARFRRRHAAILFTVALSFASVASASTWFLKEPAVRQPIEITSIGSEATWVDDQWPSRRTIDIVNLSGAPLLNYPVRVPLTFTTASPDYDDVRFSTSDERMFLPHWREEATPGAAVFYVKVPYLPSSGTTSIYVHYDNPDVRSASDGDATFNFFDDFQFSSAVVKTGANPLFEGIEPSVLKEGNEYWLYYDLGAIYRRTSPDGLTWSPPVRVTGVTGQYVHVYKDYDRVTYRMLFSDAALDAIRLATSTDGVNFIDQGVVFETGPGEWYSGGLFDPCEIMTNGQYYLYFGGRGSNPNGQIGLATSSSGKPGSYVEVASSPVIQPTGSGIAATGVFDADVFQYIPGRFMMFYTGYDASTSRQVATYATSDDLVDWTPSEKELYWVSQDWEGTALYGPNEPSVLVENDRYVVWYRGSANAISAPNYIGRATIPRHPTTLEPDPASRWSTLKSTLTVGDGQGIVASSQAGAYLYTTFYRLTNGLVETKMKRDAGTYFNANLSARVDAVNSLEQSIGPAGATTQTYLFEHVPGFLANGNSAFAITPADDHVYQLTMQNLSLIGRVRRVSDGATTTVTGTASTIRNGAVGLYVNKSTASLDWFRTRQPEADVSVTVSSVEEAAVR